MCIYGSNENGSYTVQFCNVLHEAVRAVLFIPTLKYKQVFAHVVLEVKMGSFTSAGLLLQEILPSFEDF